MILAFDGNSIILISRSPPPVFLFRKHRLSKSPCIRHDSLIIINLIIPSFIFLFTALGLQHYDDIGRYNIIIYTYMIDAYYYITRAACITKQVEYTVSLVIHHAIFLPTKVPPLFSSLIFSWQCRQDATEKEPLVIYELATSYRDDSSSRDPSLHGV